MPEEGAELAPREEFTDIRVDRDGQWYTRDRLIINKRILAFFKTNLHRDEKGIYIYSNFRQFSEKGYIKVGGPILWVTDIMQGNFVLETNAYVPIERCQIILDDQERPLIFLPALEAWAGLTKNALMQFGEDMKEKDGKFFWQDAELIKAEDINWG